MSALDQEVRLILEGAIPVADIICAWPFAMLSWFKVEIDESASRSLDRNCSANCKQPQSQQALESQSQQALESAMLERFLGLGPSQSKYLLLRERSVFCRCFVALQMIQPTIQVSA